MLHKQTAAFIARIGQNLPDLSSRQMQAIMQKPLQIQRALKCALDTTVRVSIRTGGQTGQQWIEKFQQRKQELIDYEQSVLLSDKFIPTIAEYKLCIINGNEFTDAERTTGSIDAEAKERGYLIPPVEVAPYLVYAFRSIDLLKMEIDTLVVMHEPVTDSGGYVVYLVINAHKNFLSELGRTFAGEVGCERDPQCRWNERRYGFVYLDRK